MRALAEARMPYKSKAEQESERWMTLPEAVDHICATDHIDVGSARRELLKALKNDAFYMRGIYLVRWKSTFEISGRKHPAKLAPLPDVPPRGQEWSQAKIRWASGKVLDPYGALKNGKWVPTWRVVWLARSKVIQLWSESRRPFNAATSAAGPSRANLVGRRPGPKPKKSPEIIEAIKADLKANLLTTAQLRDMEDKELCSKYGDKFGAARTTVREAREKVLTEFDGV
jgi:hypothetical protein